MGNLCDSVRRAAAYLGQGLSVWPSVTACQDPVTPQRLPVHQEHHLPWAPVVVRLWTHVPHQTEFLVDLGCRANSLHAGSLSPLWESCSHFKAEFVK